MTADWLVVGAGFSGSVIAERLASQMGQRVVVVDRRPHIAGNAFDSYDSDGLLVHNHGPHIFHTNSSLVWEYLSQFTGWRPYEHHVRAVVDDRTVPLPFNLNSLDAVYPAAQAVRLGAKLASAFGENARVPVLQLRQHADSELRTLGEWIYANVFYKYTLKQWGLRPEDLANSVTARVPVLIGRDDRYFNDRYQAMPLHGYAPLFERMLSSPNITVLLATDYCSLNGSVRFNRMVYTGPLDAFFDYIHGALPYRSMRFVMSRYGEERVQPVGTVNYPNDQPFTRVTEFKHLTGQTGPRTVTATEYPEAHIPGHNEPYYPIPTEETGLLRGRYLAMAAELRKSVTFIGRLAEYRYYNMDQAVARALKAFDEIARGESNVNGP